MKRCRHRGTTLQVGGRPIAALHQWCWRCGAYRVFQLNLGEPKTTVVGQWVRPSDPNVQRPVPRLHKSWIPDGIVRWRRVTAAADRRLLGTLDFPQPQGRKR